jgi:4'-phosphopantetheinyl transferase
MTSVYTLAVGKCTDEELSRAASLLDSEEKARADRFVFPEHKRLYTLAHGMVRTTLARALGRDPRALRFVIGSHGKPSIEGVSFNLSHTDGLVAVAVGNGALGVDVEDSERRTDILGVCDRFFAPAEVDALRALPASAQRERFFRYWTLKESYIKARGLGLAIPLEDFAFTLDSPEITVAFVPRLQDDPGRWRFGQEKLGRYLVALCTEKTEPPMQLEPFSFY